MDYGVDRLSSKFRLEIEWGRSPASSIHPPVFSSTNSEEVYFEHVDVQYIPETSSSGKVVRLLQASDLDSEIIWFHILGKLVVLFNGRIKLIRATFICNCLHFLRRLRRPVLHTRDGRSQKN